MNRYLLLRDNKQSGPYSVAELVAKGIKPYDLVWLDGRSAAWRYPSEIDELRAHSPAVEEQPYDRFYKKPAYQQKEARSTIAENTVSVAGTTQAVQFQDNFTSRPVSGELPVEIPAIQHDQPRKIYVTLPGTASKTTVKPSPRQKERDADQQNPVSVQQVNDEKTGSPVMISRPVQPAEEVKPARVELSEDTDENERIAPYAPVPADKKAVRRIWSNTPVADPAPSFSDRISSDLTKNSVSSGGANREPARTDRTRLIMTAIIAVCLLLGGVIIGLTISNSKNESQANLDRLVKQIQDRQTSNGNTPSILPGEAVVTVPATDEISRKPAESGPVVEDAPIVEKPRPVRQAVATPATQPAVDPASELVSVPTREEKTTVPEPAVIKQQKTATGAEADEARKNIRQLVLLQNNKYKTGVLGGISDLELTISNKSEYELDVVEVTVDYLGPERRVIRSQTIVFNNVKPGRTSVQEVPKSSRGVSVTTSIRSIQSRSLGLASTSH